MADKYCVYVKGRLCKRPGTHHDKCVAKKQGTDTKPHEEDTEND